MYMKLNNLDKNVNKKSERIGILYNPELKEAKKLALVFESKLKNSKVFTIDNFKKDVDIAISIGGDGTFLKAARFYSKSNTPILGLNVGRLGFLTQAGKNEIDSVIEKLKSKDYTIENRIMLKSGLKTALNDIVIKGANPNRTSTLTLLINNKKLCSYVADGLIISTPTGSTAYSLSAGGPVIAPNIDCFLIIPICPHTLNTRPLIVPIDEKITIENQDTDNKLHISYDGQVERTDTGRVEIEKSKNFAKLIILNQQKDKFYDILKEKLNWSATPKKR